MEGLVASHERAWGQKRGHLRKLVRLNVAILLAS